MFCFYPNTTNLLVTFLICQEGENDDSDEDWGPSRAADFDSDEDLDYEAENATNLQIRLPSSHELAAVWALFFLHTCGFEVVVVKTINNLFSTNDRIHARGSSLGFRR